MSLTTLLGLLASCLSVTAFVPQVFKAWRTRSTGDVSASMFGLLASGCVAWIIYGTLRDDWPVVVTNAVILALTLAMLALKWRHG